MSIKAEENEAAAVNAVADKVSAVAITVADAVVSNSAAILIGNIDTIDDKNKGNSITVWLPMATPQAVPVM